jgi:hypothetical protein
MLQPDVNFELWPNIFFSVHNSFICCLEKIAKLGPFIAVIAIDRQLLMQVVAWA